MKFAAGIKAIAPISFIRKSIKLYGQKTIEDRAIPDFRDGMKPVQRRILWAMYELNLKKNFRKSAKVVGDVIGNYHPHSDQAAYQSMVTMANSPTKLIEGQGNWGDAATGDAAASMRYTECRLSEYSTEFLLDPEYIAVTPMVDNFEGTTKEPLFLPSKLPTVLLTANYGIAVAVNVSFPPFTLEFIKYITKYYLEKGKFPQRKSILNKMAFAYKEGGNCLATHEDLNQLWEEGKGAIRFQAEYEIDEKAKTLTINSNVADSNIDNLVKKSYDYDEVRTVENQSSDKIKYVIFFKTSVTQKDVRSLAEKIIEKNFTKQVSYRCSVTERLVDEKTGDVKADFSYATIASILEMWRSYRVDLELAYLEDQILKNNAQLEKLEVLSKAANRIVELAKIIAKQDKPLPHIQKLLSVTEDQAKMVMATSLGSLSRFEVEKTRTQMELLKNKIQQLKKDSKEPAQRCARMIK